MINKDIIEALSITALSTQIGRDEGRPKGVTPPTIIPVMFSVSSPPAKEAFFVPSFLRTAPFTSSLCVANKRHKVKIFGFDLPTNWDFKLINSLVN